MAIGRAALRVVRRRPFLRNTAIVGGGLIGAEAVRPGTTRDLLDVAERPLQGGARWLGGLPLRLGKNAAGGAADAATGPDMAPLILIGAGVVAIVILTKK